MSLPPFEYVAPTTTAQLAGLLASHGPKARILAGGTDLVNWMAERVYQPDVVIDLKRIPELAGISVDEAGGLVIGAATTLETIERSPVVRERVPALAFAASQIGSPQIRAMATVGGNCCNASPCADMPPPLVSLGAVVELAGGKGTRRILLEEFITGNRQTAIGPDEYLARILVPAARPQSACRYAPFGLRAAQEIDIASVAAMVALDPATGLVSCARITMGAVAPFAMRAREAEALLEGRKPEPAVIDRAADSCGAECRPIDDLRASAGYRRHIVKVLARQVLREAVSAIG